MVTSAHVNNNSMHVISSAKNIPTKFHFEKRLKQKKFNNNLPKIICKLYTDLYTKPHMNR